MLALRHEEFLAEKRFTAFDGLRAVATLLVFGFHFGGPSCDWLSGWVGVHVFFALSGFLITTLALREESARGRISLANFYVRRLFRIVPAYAVVLALTLVIGKLNGGPTWDHLHAALPYYLTFMNDFAPRASFEISWTIGIEQKFYLVWPLAAFAIVALRPARIVVTLVLGAVVAYFTFARGKTFLVHFLVILEGCLLAIVMHGRRGFAIVRPLTHPIAALPVLAAVVVAHLAIPKGIARFGEIKTIALYGIAVVLLLPTLIGRTPTRFFLAMSPLVAIGKRSYSLYLIQMTASAAASGLIPAIARNTLIYLAATLAVALVFADVIYRWVELPLIEQGREIIERRRARRPPSSILRLRS